MAKLPNDYELDFLKTCTAEELAPLVGAILGTNENGEIDRSGRFSSSLDKAPAFVANLPDHTKYVDEIIEEIQKFGGNSIANAWRGMGVSYHEVLCDAAKKMKVNFKRTQRTELIETHLLATVLDEVWEKMSEEDRQKILKESGHVIGFKAGGMGAAALVKVLQAGGFETYKIALIVVNAISKAVLGHGLRLAGNVYLTRLLAVLAGPVGWIGSGIWMAFDFASPAYRVTIRACIYIAALRAMKANEKFAGEEKSVIENA